MALNNLQNLIVIREECKKHFPVFCVVLIGHNGSIVLGALDCDLIPGSRVH
jgi:hypothetical protein